LKKYIIDLCSFSVEAKDIEEARKIAIARLESGEERGIIDAVIPDEYEENRFVLPICRKCKKPLENISEEYKGTDRIFWDEDIQRYDKSLPEGRVEEPSKFFCRKCGHPLTKKQQAEIKEKLDSG